MTNFTRILFLLPVLLLSSSSSSSSSSSHSLCVVDGFVTQSSPPCRHLATTTTTDHLRIPSITTTRTRRRRRQQHRTKVTATQLSLSRWRNTDEIEGPNVLKSCIPYLLPLVDGDHYGRFIYQHIPPMGFLDSLFIGPLAENFDQVPLAGLIFFLALTLGTRGNTEMDRTVRFNAQQAALIDVALVLPELVASIFDGVDMPRQIVEPSCNFVWYAYMSAILYSMYSIVILRRKPDQIPWISPYSEQMTGPF
jgi:Chloroplast import apparatus Tic20-like